jgi:hypothetical protein
MKSPLCVILTCFHRLIETIQQLRNYDETKTGRKMGEKLSENTRAVQSETVHNLSVHSG